MRRITLFAAGGLILVGLLGYNVLFVDLAGSGNEERTVNATITDFNPGVSVNTLTLEQALTGNGTNSCINNVPMPESWQLEGSAFLERQGTADGQRTFSWTLTIDGQRQFNGTKTLDRYGPERVPFFHAGEWNGTFEPGSTATANLTVSHNGTRVASETGSITIQNQSEPPCPEE